MVKLVIEGEPKEVREFLDSLNARGGAIKLPESTFHTASGLPTNKLLRTATMSRMNQRRYKTTYDPAHLKQNDLRFDKAGRLIYASVLGQSLEKHALAMASMGKTHAEIVADVVRQMNITDPKIINRVRMSVYTPLSRIRKTGSKTPKTALDTYKALGGEPFNQPNNQELTERARLFGKKRMLFSRFLGSTLLNFVELKTNEGMGTETIIAEVVRRMSANKTRSLNVIRRAVKQAIWILENKKVV